MCEVLQVSTSGYYKWLNKHDQEPSEREKYKKEIQQQIAKSFHESEGTYGSPRIYDDLIEWGYMVSQKTVARMMKEMGLRATPNTPYVVTTDSDHDMPIYPNLLMRDFKTDEPNKVWVTDITYIRTLQGWVYLACVMDLFSRKIVGWSISDNMKKELPLEALQRAIITRQPLEGLIHHSDRGSQYCSHEYTSLLEKNKAQISMSRKGNPYDNACIESFHATIKKELVYRRRFETKAEAEKAINSYIFRYNERRKHSTLGYYSPNQFERKHLSYKLSNIS